MEDRRQQRCVMSQEGMCKSDYGNGIKCNGKNIPVRCPYNNLMENEEKN
jgi:hypothetical protein